MQPHTRFFLVVAVLLISVGLWAQEAYLADVPDVLARLSYDTSAVVQREGVRQICLSVSRDGDYRIVRLDSLGTQQRLHGKIPKEQFEHLKALLGSAEFRSVSGDHGGLIRQESESFSAEIPMSVSHHENETHRLQWLNADGESPFPASVAKVVDWLKHFEPKNGKPFEYAEFPDVCPAGGLRLLQPALASNARP